MVFSSIEFIFRFLIVFLGIYCITPKKFKNAVLLGASLIFYAWGEPVYVFLMAGSILLNYVIAQIMVKSNRKKLWLTIAVVADLSMLFVFKYLNFFIENVNNLSGKTVLEDVELTLPIGISFYTFQIISYVIDVYRNKYPAEKNIVAFAAYVSMFPQLIAGPIVNYDEVKDELKERSVRPKDLEAGVVAFIIGLSYKVLLANQIGTMWNSIQTVGVYGITSSVAWLGAWAYSFQLLFDFAGYSMMAIGLGRIMGFFIPMNFADPYTSRSVTEFWRRWHITLGRWFREYVYIPLGGNRKGKARLILNLFITWALTGLWHGAHWNFVIWGVMWAALIIIEKLFLYEFLNKDKLINKLISRAYMLLMIPISWVIFVITDIKEMGLYFARMFGLPIKELVKLDSEMLLEKYVGDYWWLFIICILCSTPLPVKWIDKFYDKFIVKVILMILFWLSVYMLLTSENNPFLYFRF